MHALRVFALIFLLAGSALCLSSAEGYVHAQVEDNAVLLVNVYAPTNGSDDYTVETVPVHGAAYVPFEDRTLEKMSLAFLFMVLGYGCHVLAVRTPILSVHWNKYLQVQVKRLKTKKKKSRK